MECAVRLSGESPARDFLEQTLEEVREKGKDQPQATARARFMVLFQQMADYGNVQAKRLGPEMDSLYAFKHEVKKIQIRFPCFQDGDKWILTHGFMKPGAKKGLGNWPPAEVARAQEIRGEYYQRKNALSAAAKGKKK